MRIDHRLPDVALRPVIDRYWSWEHTSRPPPALLPLMPGPGGMEIFFHFHTPFAHQSAANGLLEPLAQAHIACVRRKPVRLVIADQFGFVAVRVRAGAIPRLTGMPATKLVESVTAADDIWGKPASELCERLALADGPMQRAALLDAFFHRQLHTLQCGGSIEHAIALLQRHQARIADVAAATGLCRRQLEYRFQAATGSSPVRFRRLARLQRALRALLLASPDQSLTFLLDPAYFDQAQQTHEFRVLTGFSPSEVRRAVLDGYAHFYNRSWPR
jgi:AraC-like DNA-binding protein